MLIGELAKRTGCSRDTLRFYGKLGLLDGARAQTGSNSYRHYDEQMVERILLVKQAKLLGFTLREIAGLIAAWEANTLGRGEKIKIFEDKIALVEQRIAELTKVREYLGAKLKMLRGSTTASRVPPSPRPGSIRSKRVALTARSG